MLEGAWDQAALVTWSICFEGNLIKGADRDQNNFT